MPYYYHSGIKQQITKEKIKFSERIISYWRNRLHKKDSKRRKDWKLIVAKLHDIEVHFEGLNQCLEEMKRLDEEVYNRLLEDYVDKTDIMKKSN